MLSSAPLCRCICGSRRDDPLDPNRALAPELESIGDVDDSPSAQAKVPGLLSYCASSDQPLRGVPIREGGLWLLSAEEEVAMVTLSLYVNGFCFTHKGREHSFSLSPFALVRNCKFQATTSDGVDLSTFKCFKVSLFTQGACLYFGVRSSTGEEREAEEERSRWVVDISRAMRLVTQSLFPPFSIACEPLASVGNTHRRLMAGYIVHHEDAATASVLYCELHAQSKEQARLMLYENELCEALLLSVPISERSTCCEKVGISCSCFSVEDHLFSSRTLAERKLWLRAISNVKVKLQNRAPSPTCEELRQYRGAIKEYIRTSRGAFQGQAPMDALLQRRTPTMSMLRPPPEAPEAMEGTGAEAPPPQDASSPKALPVESGNDAAAEVGGASGGA
uniref:PH domain-containing protein n=1 Tax=Alexandrium monilatum TaxID=311494 RepID=A0A7S4SRK6_9DINO|mmetsp:Transcript_86194/g.257296  ORF Transcript_86194/g.257296 Transcript_86194/m.257296 type:complete len:392 (+) Transcript_86194:82-1257(+)